MANLFPAAASDPALMTEIVEAMRSAASGAGVALSDDPLHFVQSVSQNAAFRSGLQSQLSRLAATRGLAFEPEVPVPAEIAAAQLKAIEGTQATQIPIGTPIVFLFVAAALIFAPSVFKSVGGTIFGEDAIPMVEGIEPFG
jgi:hypothetical protein